MLVRIRSALLTYQFLVSTDADEIENYISEMETANRERKALEKIILSTAVKQISNSEIKRPYTMVKGKGLAQGVIGIIASRLKTYTPGYA